MAPLSLNEREPFKIRPVSDKIGRLRDKACGFGRDPRIAARTKANDPQPP